MSPFHAAGEQWQMLEGNILMSRRERERLAVLAQVKSGELKLVTAGAVMGVSYRQAKRVWRRYRIEGDAGLVHRSRGRPSPRRKPPEIRRRVLARYGSGMRILGRRWRRSIWRGRAWRWITRRCGGG